MLFWDTFTPTQYWEQVPDLNYTARNLCLRLKLNLKSQICAATVFHLHRIPDKFASNLLLPSVLKQIFLVNLSSGNQTSRFQNWTISHRCLIRLICLSSGLDSTLIIYDYLCFLPVGGIRAVSKHIFLGLLLFRFWKKTVVYSVVIQSRAQYRGSTGVSWGSQRFNNRNNRNTCDLNYTPCYNMLSLVIWWFFCIHSETVEPLNQDTRFELLNRGHSTVPKWHTVLPTVVPTVAKCS